MLNDFDVIQHNLPEDIAQIEIAPVSDLHYGDIHANLELWMRFKNWVLSEPYRYLTIGGDTMNNQLKNSKTNVYEGLRPADQKKWLANELSELRDRILCVVPGNHEKRSALETDDEPLYDICCKIDIEDRYRPNAAFLMVSLGKKENKKPAFYSICVQHGSGGGVLLGSALNGSERFANTIDGLDIYISGHVHKNAMGKPAKLVIDPHNKKVTFKPMLIVVAKPWMNYGGYALEKRLLPTFIGDNQIITLSGREKKFTGTI